MKKRIVLRFLAMRIEYHWWFIMRSRKICSKMLDEGEPLSAPRLIALNRRISRYCIRVMKDQKRYEDLAGVTELRTRQKSA